MDQDAKINENDASKKLNLCPHNLKCKTFDDAKKNYKYSFDVLYHLEQYRHSNRIQCQHGKECKAYKRLCDGGYRLDDRCHVLLYIHGTRLRDKDVIPPKWNSFSTHHSSHDDIVGAGPQCPSKNVKIKKMKQTRKELNLKPNDKYVEDEVIKNGFNYVLYPTSGQYKHLTEVVYEKLKHPKCPNDICYDEMLSVILYTGTDVYTDIISTNRNGNYDKWKYTYSSLRSAVIKLSKSHNMRVVYRGLNKVYFDKSYKAKCCWTFDTFTSFSWDKNVAIDFCGGEGMIFEFYGVYGLPGADVSWISKFPDECELLCSLGPGSDNGHPSNGSVTCFEISWSANHKIQTVKLTDDVG